MAKALMEAGHHPDQLYGTSAGALNAAWLAAEPTLEGLEALARLWTVVRSRDIFPLSAPVAIAGFAGWKDHLVSPRALAKWLRSTVLVRRLEDGVLPLTVVTTDLETGEEVLLESGPAVPALLASSAMPGVFPPVRLGGRWLIDGSVVSDTPVGPAVRAGADRVFVLPSVPAGTMARPRSALNVLLRSTSISLARHNVDALAAWCGRCQLYVVPAPLVPGVSPFSFNRSPELIDAAYRLTSSWLAQARPVAPSAPPEGVEGPLGATNLQGPTPER
jgi:NTE family protein